MLLFYLQSIKLFLKMYGDNFSIFEYFLKVHYFYFSIRNLLKLKIKNNFVHWKKLS